MRGRHRGTAKELQSILVRIAALGCCYLRAIWGQNVVKIRISVRAVQIVRLAGDVETTKVTNILHVEHERTGHERRIALVHVQRVHAGEDELATAGQEVLQLRAVGGRQVSYKTI